MDIKQKIFFLLTCSMLAGCGLKKPLENPLFATSYKAAISQLQYDNG